MSCCLVLGVVVRLEFDSNWRWIPNALKITVMAMGAKLKSFCGFSKRFFQDTRGHTTVAVTVIPRSPLSAVCDLGGGKVTCGHHWSLAILEWHSTESEMLRFLNYVYVSCDDKRGGVI